MTEIPNESLFDVRLIERHTRQGLITRQDYEKYLSELPDRETEADPIDLEELAEITGTSGASG